jgi:putative resolvase
VTNRTADPERQAGRVVEHRDRLARFGAGYLQGDLAAHDRTVVVLDDAELPDELALDLTEVLPSMCALRHGRRSASRWAAAAVVTIQNEPDTAPGDPS